MAKDNGGKSAAKAKHKPADAAPAPEQAEAAIPAGARGPRLEQDAVPAADRLSHARRPARPRAAPAAALGRDEPLRAPAPEGAQPRQVPAARRPALRQRQHPHRARAQQDPQGSRRQIAGHARLRFQLRAGLGLPRPADRVEDRGELPRQGPQQGRGADQRVPRRVPRVRRALDRRAARGVQAPRRRRRLGASLQDHGLSRPRRSSPARS